MGGMRQAARRVASLPKIGGERGEETRRRRRSQNAAGLPSSPRAFSRCPASSGKAQITSRTAGGLRAF
eukprot:425289-Pyramimonas_sp.AAC.1